MTNHTGKKGRDYTPEEVARLIDLRAKGFSSTEIARQIGRTVSSVENKRVQIDVARRWGPAVLYGARYDTPPFRENDDDGHVASVLAVRPQGFPVAFSRPHSRRAA